MHRLLQLLITQPELLIAHGNAYTELASADARVAMNAVQHKALWTAALLCCLSVAAILGGGALMIWAALPDHAIRLPWLLLATPCVPVAAVLLCLSRLKHNVPTILFSQVREQVAADLQMLSEVQAP